MRLKAVNDWVKTKSCISQNRQKNIFFYNLVDIWDKESQDRHTHQRNDEKKQNKTKTPYTW